MTAVIGLGPAAPREFEQTIATGALFEPVIAPLRGGAVRLEDGVPALRDVREGRPAAGRGWIGLTPRGAYETRDVTQSALLPPWLLPAAGLGASCSAAGCARAGGRARAPPRPHCTVPFAEAAFASHRRIGDLGTRQMRGRGIPSFRAECKLHHLVTRNCNPYHYPEQFLEVMRWWAGLRMKLC